MKKRSQPYALFKEASHNLIEILRHGVADYMPFVNLLDECLLKIIQLKTGGNLIHKEYKRIYDHAIKFRRVQFLEFMINNYSFSKIAFNCLCNTKTQLKNSEFILLFDLINKKFIGSQHFEILCKENSCLILKKYSWKVFSYFSQKANIDVTKLLVHTNEVSVKVNLVGFSVMGPSSVQNMLHLIHAGVDVFCLTKSKYYIVSKYLYLEVALKSTNLNHAIALYMYGLRFQNEDDEQILFGHQLFNYYQVIEVSEVLMILYCLRKKRQELFIQ